MIHSYPKANFAFPQLKHTRRTQLIRLIHPNWHMPYTSSYIHMYTQYDITHTHTHPHQILITNECIPSGLRLTANSPRHRKFTTFTPSRRHTPQNPSKEPSHRSIIQSSFAAHRRYIDLEPLAKGASRARTYSCYTRTYIYIYIDVFNLDTNTYTRAIPRNALSHIRVSERDLL